MKTDEKVFVFIFVFVFVFVSALLICHLMDENIRSGRGKAMSRKGSWGRRLKFRSTTYSPEGDLIHHAIMTVLMIMMRVLRGMRSNICNLLHILLKHTSEDIDFFRGNFTNMRMLPVCQPIIIKGSYQKLIGSQIGLQM